MKQLARLLFLQGQRCFFCGRTIPPGEASVEHLVAIANKGAKDDDNCVACCKAINLAFGHMSVKAKFQAVLNQRGAVLCPSTRAAVPAPPAPADIGQPNGNGIEKVIADLRKRGSARPRRVSTLKSTMNALFQKALSEAELDALLDELESRGYVIVEGAKVSYALPPSAA